MRKAKNKTILNVKNSIDYFNFCTFDNNLPILDILNERFCRSFRVSISNYLRMISNITHSSSNRIFSDWVEQSSSSCCMFIMRLNSLDAPVLVKLDHSLSYGIIDVLAGGNGKEYKEDIGKEFTMIELTLLKSISELIIGDLNEAWKPVEEIKAQYIRTEINPQFVGIVPPSSRVRIVSYQIEFDKVKGVLEILLPYSTLFPIRDKLFSNE